jgi:ornithine cyclodeaminase
MKFFSAEDIAAITHFPSLIEALKKGFQSEIVTPKRHHHDFANPGKLDSTLLLMPSWQIGKRLGVKVVTVSPENKELPSIHGVYLLFDASNGKPIAQFEGKALTKLRTAAASALASSYLSRPDSKNLLMIGTGALAEPLIRAHCSVRNIEKIKVWGRNAEKAQAVIESIGINGVVVSVSSDLEHSVKESDIISSATLSVNPLVFGKWAKPGQHYDLVGAYKPNMREADDDLIQMVSVFVDTFQGRRESGDIAIPLDSGVLKEADVQDDLFGLTGGRQGRKNDHEITLFKSVGHALEDLVAANYFYEKLQ